MQKIFSILFALLVCNAWAWAQNCGQPQGSMLFQGNQVRYQIKVGSGFPFNCTTNLPLFLPDTTSPTLSTLFASHLWLGAYDLNGTAYIAANMYGSCRSTGADFYAGPIDATGTTICNGYDKVWSVNGSDLTALIADFADNGVINNSVSTDIMGFPCRNNPYFSTYNNGTTLLPNRDFAAFKDRNNDGIYNPMQGDYPIIPQTDGSVLPEKMAWIVYNDNGVHNETGGNPMKAEIQATYYSFSCGNLLTDRTTFVSYKIFNRNPTTLIMSAGMWADFDIGCYVDDYIGSIPSQNTMFGYNSDVYDDANCPSGQSGGFGYNIPTQSITFLNRPMTKMSYWNRNGNFQRSDPSQAQEYLNYMQGLWRDGSPYYPCGDGSTPCPDDPTATTKIVFPGKLFNSSEWSMWSPIGVAGSDFRSLAIASADTLAQNESTILTMALSCHKETEYWRNVNKTYTNIARVQRFYDSTYVGACIPVHYCTTDCVYPGDSNKDGTVNDLDVLYVGCSWNNTGGQRIEYNVNFEPVDAPTWTQPTLVNNLNRNHQDCSGDGIVNGIDTAIIRRNFGSIRPDSIPIVYTPSGITLSLESNTTRLQNLDSIPQSYLPSFIPAKIRLNGNANNQVEDFYGVAFSLDADSLFTISVLTSNPLTSYFRVDTSIYLIKLRVRTSTITPFARGIDVVIVRKDGQNFTGNAFDLMTFNLRRTTANIIYNQSVGYARFSNVRMIRNDGTILAYGAKDQGMVFTTSTTVLDTETDTPLSFSLYPNPAQTQFTLTKPTADAAKLSITDLAGRSIYTQLLTQNDTIIATENWQNGVYLVVIEENGSRAVQKIVVLH
jgi:Secretion system C-terminal sorting domain/Dockerin type I domain